MQKAAEATVAQTWPVGADMVLSSRAALPAV